MPKRLRSHDAGQLSSDCFPRKPSAQAFLFHSATHLDKCELANANTAFGISNGYFAVVLDPPPPTEDVVYARGDFIPHVVISVSTNNTALVESNGHRYSTVLQRRTFFG